MPCRVSVSSSADTSSPARRARIARTARCLAAKTGAAAGDDLILVASQHLRDGEAATAALVTAERDGTINSAGFEASAARIIALRTTLPG